MFSPAQFASCCQLNFGRSFGTLLIVGGRSGSSVYLFGFASVMAIPFAVCLLANSLALADSREAFDFGLPSLQFPSN